MYFQILAAIHSFVEKCVMSSESIFDEKYEHWHCCDVCIHIFYEWRKDVRPKRADKIIFIKMTILSAWLDLLLMRKDKAWRWFNVVALCRQSSLCCLQICLPVLMC